MLEKIIENQLGSYGHKEEIVKSEQVVVVVRVAN